MRKSYSRLALAVGVSLLIVGCSDKKLEVENKQDVKTVNEQIVKKEVNAEQQARLKLRKDIASCLSVSESKIQEPLERYIGDSVFDSKGMNDDQEFIGIIQNLIISETKIQKERFPITKDALDYESYILDKTYTTIMQRLLAKIDVNADELVHRSKSDVFSKVMLEYTQGKAVNKSIQSCLSIYGDYDVKAFEYYKSTARNDQFRAVGTQQVNSNGVYRDKNGISRKSWTFLTTQAEIEVSEKPFALKVNKESQSIPQSDENWKHQNINWSNLDKLWVESVFTNEDEIYIVLAPDNQALGITPQVFYKEVYVLSLDGKIRDRFSYKYPFVLKGKETISVSSKGFESRVEGSGKHGTFSVFYLSGDLTIQQLDVMDGEKTGEKNCVHLFEKVYLNDSFLADQGVTSEIQVIPNDLSQYLSEKIKLDPILAEKFWSEVKTLSLADKLNAPKGSFEKKYCD